MDRSGRTGRSERSGLPEKKDRKCGKDKGADFRAGNAGIFAFKKRPYRGPHFHSASAAEPDATSALSERKMRVLEVSGMALTTGKRRATWGLRRFTQPKNEAWTQP